MARTRLTALSVAVLAAVVCAARADSAWHSSGIRGLPEYGRTVSLGSWPPAPPGTAPHTGIMASTDLTGDGLPDLLAVRSQWRSHYLFTPAIFVNDGRGGFVEQTSELFTGHLPQTMGPTRVLFADFNRDGRQDVFIGDGGSDLSTDPGYQDTLILSAPGGKLVDATANLPQQEMYTAAASVADVDGNGSPDLFVGGMQWVGANEIQLNDGTGHFTVEPHGIPDDLADPAACRVVLSSAFADVDGDGSQDLVVGGGYNPCYPMPTGVLLNDGHGRFPSLTQQFPWPSTAFRTPMDITVGDVNGDNGPDIVIAYAKQDFTGQWFQLLVNDGRGHFVDQTATRLPPQRDNSLGFVKWVSLVDLNGDGNLDIASSVQPQAAPWVVASPFFLNDGAGRFSSLPPNLGLAPVDTYALAELGGGRAVDVVSGGDPGIALKRTVAPTGRRLYGTLGPQRQLSLVLDSGRAARLVAPGEHRIVVWDRSGSDGFGLRGPGVAKTSGRAYRGIAYWTVQLRKGGRYTFGSQAHPELRRVFTVRRR